MQSSTKTKTESWISTFCALPRVQQARLRRSARWTTDSPLYQRLLYSASADGGHRLVHLHALLADCCFCCGCFCAVVHGSRQVILTSSLLQVVLRGILLLGLFLWCPTPKFCLSVALTRSVSSSQPLLWPSFEQNLLQQLQRWVGMEIVVEQKLGAAEGVVFARATSQIRLHCCRYRCFD